MTSMRQKVMAYITHGERLLVFRHLDFPEAGIQVPGGSPEAGESYAEAALREAREETGLTDLTLVRALGERAFNLAVYGRDEVNVRHFYHLRCTGTPPERWEHAEMTPSEGPPGPIRFELWWARLPDEVPPLQAEMGALLPALLAALREDGAR